MPLMPVLLAPVRPVRRIAGSHRGVGKCMAEQGIIYAPGATQFYQGVAGGGNEQEFEYGGR